MKTCICCALELHALNASNIKTNFTAFVSLLVITFSHTYLFGKRFFVFFILLCGKHYIFSQALWVLQHHLVFQVHLRTCLHHQVTIAQLFVSYFCINLSFCITNSFHQEMQVVRDTFQSVKKLR